MGRAVGVNEKVKQLEYSVRAQKIRDKSFKGLSWTDPTSTVSDTDGMFWRLLGLGGSYFFFQAEDGIRDPLVTGVQTCALPICSRSDRPRRRRDALECPPRTALRDHGASPTGGGSEERRVGKECRSWGAPSASTKK